jgi:hypothetical protein
MGSDAKTPTRSGLYRLCECSSGDGAAQPVEQALARLRAFLSCARYSRSSPSSGASLISSISQERKDLKDFTGTTTRSYRSETSWISQR